jgi:hypothetical protein
MAGVAEVTEFWLETIHFCSSTACCRRSPVAAMITPTTVAGVPNGVTVLPGTRRDPGQETQRSKAEAAKRQRKAAMQEKYAAIRCDDASGMSERAIERKHHVGRRTIVNALAFAEPPPRKKFQRDPTALNGLHARIDAMIEADPRIRVSEIWQRELGFSGYLSSSRLRPVQVDEHLAALSMVTLRG